ncbi:radical SAM protein [Desulfuromonas versatilis]|uniref:Radical SAM protein n=1 Tax=Desulfuromonas versatilis TaxID=2802975 RepID=A0ABM8HS77_9BACT|nr:TatD family hydrolase [Desulfuromonas versatilis]BCR05137.1 radical SAM protein [Desulfuromonas versatilis]
MSQSLPPLIDTHAHLDHDQFDSDREAVIARAAAAGISHMLSVGCDLESSRRAIELARRYPNIYATVGIHPHDALQADEHGIAQLREMLGSSSKVVAVGEIGLDFYRDRAPRDIQRQAFRRQLALAREVGLPVVIHDRDAHDEVLQILREERIGEIGGVMHCFSGDLQMARACIELGLYLSFPGTITYPKNQAAREVVRAIPIDHMLVETDCPYLAPQIFRGKRNEPAHVRHTAEMVAEIKGLSLEDVSRITSLNSFNLFGMGEIDQTTKIAYRIRDSLYLNITNRCTNACTFCAKFKDFTVKGHHLRLDHEPTPAEVRAAIGDPARHQEVVFCGYGEPLIRLDLVKEIAAWLKEKGVRVRINTDGQANLVHGRNILPELAGLVDAISVSLNAPDATTYQHWCRSRFGERGFQGVKEFLADAPRHIPSVTATAVTLPGIDIAACRRVAEELGVAFREREYNEVG